MSPLQLHSFIRGLSLLPQSAHQNGLLIWYYWITYCSTLSMALQMSPPGVMLQWPFFLVGVFQMYQVQQVSSSLAACSNSLTLLMDSLQNALQRPLQTALQYYLITRERVKHLTHNFVQTSPPPNLTIPPDPSLASTPSLSKEIDPSTPSANEATKAMELDTLTVTSHSASLEWTSSSARESDHKPLHGAPSRHLQTACPLCFPAEKPSQPE